MANFLVSEIACGDQLLRQSEGPNEGHLTVYDATVVLRGESFEFYLCVCMYD
jgi:hypothetical protein